MQIRQVKNRIFVLQAAELHELIRPNSSFLAQCHNFALTLSSDIRNIPANMKSKTIHKEARQSDELQQLSQEQSFLLDFSMQIAAVRDKQDLQNAIFTVLDKTLHTRLAMIRVFDADGRHLSPFMYDRRLFSNAPDNFFDEMARTRITAEEKYTAQVLASSEGVIFSIEEEISKGNAYAQLWKTTGLRNVYGLPLRANGRDIGTFWLLADRLGPHIVKGICAQIAIAIANIQANEQLLLYKKQLEAENDYLKAQMAAVDTSALTGNSEQMQKVYRLIGLVADASTNVLITGETGTGKELIAKAIHAASPRKDKLMVKVNCAALPATLVESELFGHERGAFTGAADRRIGKFELADHSTLFLDEVGELSLDAQAKLLRVIQERELERIGGRQTISIDVRLIAATNRDLEAEVKAGRFRADLYFRLNVFPIHLPPLRERAADIEALTRFFVQQYSRSAGHKIKNISPAVLQQLRSYSWPGNVRELEHLIERSILLTTGTTLSEVYLPQPVLAVQEPAAPAGRSLEEVERTYIIATLRQCSGKISGPGGAAELLQIPGNTLHSKIKKLGIRKADYFS